MITLVIPLFGNVPKALFQAFCTDFEFEHLFEC
jgi:hypothetical protein